MSTSKPGPNGNGTPNAYARFIPREELGTFAVWSPETFEQPAETHKPEEVGGLRKPTLAERAAAEVRPTMKSGPVHHAPQTASQPTQAAPSGQAKPAAWRPIVGGMPGQAEAAAMAHAEAQAAAAAAAAQAEPAPDVEALLDEARQSGYQDGYRNGLAALESYKQAQAAQMASYMSEQVGALVAGLQQRLDSVEQQLAGRIAGVALELARQVVRSELMARPEVVVDVAEQALTALLSSARQIVLRLHPEDHAMVQAQLSELLQARGARLVGDPGVTRGGCLVDSDIALVDASVEARWERVAASMGQQATWNGGREAQAPTARPAFGRDEAASGRPVPAEDAVIARDEDYA